MPPRIASFTGRADELDWRDAILLQDKPAAVMQASVSWLPQLPKSAALWRRCCRKLKQQRPRTGSASIRAICAAFFDDKVLP
jgi:hypothetical protein